MINYNDIESIKIDEINSLNTSLLTVGIILVVGGIIAIGGSGLGGGFGSGGF